VDYRISFKVERESTITEVMNYPNPFSTSTRFVFTLTGITVPEYIKIEILTVTGKVVREIFKEELGSIRIGRNVTEYAWDGRDEYGDPLANGIYLYRVIVKDAGQDVELRQTAASTFFKKGFGKMYLMR
jgi:flagellar hook assembly protein FlgD